MKRFKQACSFVLALVLVLSIVVPHIGQAFATDLNTYLASCTKYASYLSVKTTTATKLMSHPCGTSTDSGSALKATVAANTVLFVSALYKNTANEYWYEVNRFGNTMYVKAADTTLLDHLTGDITATDFVSPGSLADGASFPIGGTITSSVNKLGEITAAMYWGNDLTIAPVISASEDASNNTYTLDGSNIDYNMNFGALDTGVYTYTVTADAHSYYIDDNDALAESVKTIVLERHRCIITDYTNPNEITGFGVDVSVWNGSIDWSIAKDHIDFAILRSGFETTTDTRFHEYAAACNKYGIPFGIYVYSYAESVAEAEAEARYAISLVSQYDMDLPIFFDAEDACIAALGASKIREVTKAFIEVVRDAGYDAGIYTTSSWFRNYYTTSYFNSVAKWVAQIDGYYGGYTCSYNGGLHVWQYSWEGSVPGIYSNSLDVDYYYDLLPGQTNDNTYRSKCTVYPSNLLVTTNASVTMKKYPCNSSTDSSSTDVKSVSANTSLHVTALYKNTAGEYWYQVDNGTGVGYIPANKATVNEFLYDDVAVVNPKMADNIAVGAAYGLKGFVTARHNTLDEVHAKVYSGENTLSAATLSSSGTPRKNEYYLNYSDVDNGLTFNKLSEGYYTYEISADVTNYYVNTSGALASKEENVVVWEKPFTVGNPSASHTCTPTETPRVEPTCNEPGLTAGSSCAVCGNIITAQQTIPATGHSFSNGVCTKCGAACPHDYSSKSVAATCKVPAHSIKTCKTCGYVTTEYASYSTWSTTKPTGVDESLIVSKTQYRYSDKETKTSNNATESGYTQVGSTWDAGTQGSVEYVNSWSSGFNTSNSLYSQYNKKSAKVTAGETATTKTVINSDAITGYLYFHWCYTDSYYSYETKQGSYTTFHAYYSTTNPDSYTCDTSDMSYKTSNTSCCTNSEWFFVDEVYTQKYTTYQKVYNHERWGAWSSWSDTAVTASDNRKVETQTLYAYANGQLADHKYVNGVCSVCGDTQAVTTPKVILAGDFNSWDTGAQMTLSNNTATKTLYLTPGTYEFKIIDSGVYLGNNGTIVDTTTTTSSIGWEMTETGNCKLKVTIPGEFTFKFNTDTNYLTVTCAYGPVYLRGSFNDWGTANVLTNNGNRTYSTTVTLDAGNYTYKVGTSDWTAAWPSEDKALNLTAKSEVTVTLTLKADGNHEVTHTIVPLGSTTTYTCQLAALEVSCDAEVLLRMKMIIGDSIINNDKSYVVMTKDGEDTIFTAADLRAMGTDSKGRYVLEQGIASGEMTYDVTVKIYNGNGQLENIYDYATGAIGTSVTRNVMDYAERIFNLGTQEQKNLIAALVTYGGYSQLHFNTDAGNPAYNALTNCGMSIPNIQSITADSFTQQISRTGNAIGITQTNTRVFLDSAIYMRAYFVLDAGKSIDDYTFTLTYSVNNNERTKTLEPGYDAVNNRYYVDIEDIAAAYLDYMYTITVTNGSGTYVVKTSAMAWAKLAMQATTDVNQINMIKAMYYYNQAANTYFGK